MNEQIGFKSAQRGRTFLLGMVLGGLLVLGGLYLIRSLNEFSFFQCENDQITEVVSPNGGLKAVIFRRSCGATTPYSSHLSILPASEKITDDSVGDIYRSYRERNLTARWLDNTHLQVNGAAPDELGFQVVRSGHIHIQYSP